MAADDVLRPEWLAFEKQLGFRPLLRGPTYDDFMREDRETGKHLLDRFTFAVPDPSVKRTWHETTAGVRVKSYIPPTLVPNRPVVFYIHGGGFVLGSVDQDDRFLNADCIALGCVFVSVEYRLAPQHRFPASFDDCVDAAKWTIENAAKLGGKSGPIVIMGKSAGGSLAFATALKLIEDGRGSDILGVVACQPCTAHPSNVPDELRAKYTSYDENAENTVNTRDGMLAFYNLYNAPPNNPHIFPIHNKNLGSLPRVYMNGCGADTLRDDARLMKQLLDKHSVPNQYDEYAKLPHYFFAFPGADLAPLKAEYFEKTRKGIQWVANGGAESTRL